MSKRNTFPGRFSEHSRKCFSVSPHEEVNQSTVHLSSTEVVFRFATINHLKYLFCIRTGPKHCEMMFCARTRTLLGHLEDGNFGVGFDQFRPHLHFYTTYVDNFQNAKKILAVSSARPVVLIFLKKKFI